MRRWIDAAAPRRTAGRLPPDAASAAASFAQQLCAGMLALHQRGVAHAALRPACVLVTVSVSGAVAIVQVAGLGLALAVPRPSHHASASPFATPRLPQSAHQLRTVVNAYRAQLPDQYVAPELRATHSTPPSLTAAFDAACHADVHNFGVIVLELFTGALPPVADAAWQLVPVPLRPLLRRCVGTADDRPTFLELHAVFAGAVEPCSAEALYAMLRQ